MSDTDYQQHTNNATINFSTIKETPGWENISPSITRSISVICGAGPSLDHDIRDLHIARQSGAIIVFAVSRAARTLCDRGIIPDFIVHADPYMDSDLCAGLPVSPILILPSHVHPSWFSKLPNKKFTYFNADLKINFEMAFGKGLLRQFIGGGGSVSHDAFQLARLCGPVTIVLLGMDHCYSPEGFAYCRSSTNIEPITGPPLISAIDKNGNPAYTTKVLLNQLEYFRIMTAFRPKYQDYLNAGSFGLTVPGFRNIKIGEMARGLNRNARRLK